MCGSPAILFLEQPCEVGEVERQGRIRSPKEFKTIIRFDHGTPQP